MTKKYSDRLREYIGKIDDLERSLNQGISLFSKILGSDKHTSESRDALRIAKSVHETDLRKVRDLFYESFPELRK